MQNDLLNKLAEWLHNEIKPSDRMPPEYAWPESDDDDGHRPGEGAVRIVPPDIVAHYRDAAERLMSAFSVSEKLRWSVAITDITASPGISVTLQKSDPNKEEWVDVVSSTPAPHPDDVAVDSFASAMKAKMKKCR